MRELPIFTKEQFGVMTLYLKSYDKIGNMRWNSEAKAYLTCDPQDLENTPYHSQAIDWLKKSIFASVQNGTIYVFGSTYKVKDEIKDIGVRGFVLQPFAYWQTKYSSRVAKKLNERFGFNLEIIEDAKAKIKVTNAKVFVYNIDKNISWKISQALSYQDINAQWMDGSGMYYLFNYKEGSAPIGFLQTIMNILNENEVAFEVVDERFVKNPLALEWNGVTLRDYQVNTVNHCADKTLAFVSSPTGTGKTEIGMGIIHKLQASALILVHKKELLYQWKKRIEQTLNVKVGLIGDGLREEGDITVATIQTIYNNFGLIKKDYDIFIVDEAHHISADTFYGLSPKINARYRFGLSATPFREDGHEMKLFAHLGELYQSITPREAIERGFLLKPIFEVIKGSNAYHRKWQTEVAQTSNDPRVNATIVERAIELLNEGRYIYIDVRTIEHGKILNKMFKEKNIPSDFIYGQASTEKRLSVLEEFSKGGRILISTLLKEGVDLPIMDTIILGGVANSMIENLQKIGRVLRNKPTGQDKPLVIDRQDYGRHTSKWFARRQRLLHKYYNE